MWQLQILCRQSYLDQEEGDAVRPQRARQLDVFHFGFDLSHLSAVFVLLRVRENKRSADERLLPARIAVIICATNNWKVPRTWKTFFSAPLCLMYSFGRNSFRLEEEWSTTTQQRWNKPIFLTKTFTLQTEGIYFLLPGWMISSGSL